ncbi:uncharacterized protein LOC132785017 isoform X1 [Drosophila nasuta]|uniref:uncharacterized protein LOC132785017 isoform X1 n=1 Tax=Drosophila nasuta TaxID=42062 RepID=UPI00295EA62E|nr:uncharacterized protein LOC132785017 isoform X1 [Drosophila nasuta]
MSLSLVIFIMFISSHSFGLQVIETAPLNKTEIKSDLIEILSKSNLSTPELQVAEDRDPQETMSLNSIESAIDLAEISSKSNLSGLEDALVDDLQVAEAKPIKQQLSTKKKKTERMTINHTKRAAMTT